MNISSASLSSTNQSFSVQSRPQGPPPKQGKEQLSNALQSIGVDESTTTSVLTQIDEAISVLESESTSGKVSHNAIQSAIESVLEANGIDTAKVREAIQANGPAGSGGPSGAGRPNGPPPSPRQDDGDSGTLQSALLSAGVDESSTDELFRQIMESFQAQTSDGNVSSDKLQSALNSILKVNGVNLQAFEQATSNRFDAVGLFQNRLV